MEIIYFDHLADYMIIMHILCIYFSPLFTLDRENLKHADYDQVCAKYIWDTGLYKQ